MSVPDPAPAPTGPVGIIGALPQEIAMLDKHVEDREEVSLGGSFSFTKGTLGGMPGVSRGDWLSWERWCVVVWPSTSPSLAAVRDSANFFFFFFFFFFFVLFCDRR